MFKIAIIGRPNVGKSTLFNKLVGKKIAIVDNIAGVTRDYKISRAKLADLEFEVIDTAGLEDNFKDNILAKKMVEKTNIAIRDANLCLFMVDGKNGVTSDDLKFSKILKKINKKIILIANKCENFDEEHISKEYYKLGFDKPIAISAEHKLGFDILYQTLATHINQYNEDFADLINNNNKPDIQIAIIGRPNAGKSTLINQIINQDRVITSDIAGVTRDSIAIDHIFKNKKIRLIDTAGIRKKTNINSNLESYSVADSFHAIRFAHLAILLIDCDMILDHQDLALASQILKEGRALIFAINKIDKIKGDKEQFMKKVRLQIQQLLPEISGAIIIAVSAQNGYNIEKLLNYCLSTYQQWQQKLSTSQLNEWLNIAISNHKPPLHKGKEVKLKYITQIKIRPPTFVAFTNYPKAIIDSYKRYLVNNLRQNFSLNLTNIRFYIRKSDNPYALIKEKKFSKKTHKKK